MQHSFDLLIAKNYGVNIAIFLNNMAFWVQKNVANNKHCYDGRFWTYNTQNSFSVIFPYWSRQNIRTIIKQAAGHGLIITGNFNEVKYDQTTWYSFTEKGLLLFPCLKSDHDRAMLSTKSPGWNQPMDRVNLTNESVRTNQPIPDIKPDIKPDRERSRKNRAPATLSFEPDKHNQELAHRLGVNIEAEVKSFTSKKPPGKWSQSEFEQWLKYAKEHKDKYRKDEVRSTVPEYGPGHELWESRHRLGLVMKRELNF